MGTPFPVFAKILPDVNKINLINGEIGLDYITKELVYKDDAGVIHRLALSSMITDLYTPTVIDILQDTLTGTIGIGKKPSDGTALNISGLYQALFPKLSVEAAGTNVNLGILIKDESGVAKDLIEIPALFKNGSKIDAFNAIDGTITRNNKVETTHIYSKTDLTNNSIYKIGQGHSATIITSSNNAISSEANKDITTERGKVYVSSGDVYYIWDKTTVPSIPQYIASAAANTMSGHIKPHMTLYSQGYTMTLVPITKVSGKSSGGSFTIFTNASTINSIYSIKKIDTEVVDYIGASISTDKKSINGLIDGSSYEIICISNDTIAAPPKIFYQVVQTRSVFLGYIQNLIKYITSATESSNDGGTFDTSPNSAVKRDMDGNIRTTNNILFGEDASTGFNPSNSNIFSINNVRGGGVLGLNGRALLYNDKKINIESGTSVPTIPISGEFFMLHSGVTTDKKDVQFQEWNGTKWLKHYFASRAELVVLNDSRTLQSFVDSIPNTVLVYSLTASGSANTYTATDTKIKAYTAGLKINLKINASNTGASTINISSIGAKSIKKINAAGAKVNVDANDLLLNSIIMMEYDGTDFIIVSASGGMSNELLYEIQNKLQYNIDTVDDDGEPTSITYKRDDGTKYCTISFSGQDSIYNIYTIMTISFFALNGTTQTSKYTQTAVLDASKLRIASLGKWTAA